MEDRVKALWKRWAGEQDDEARKRLIEHYFPWVQSVARNYARSLPDHADTEDLSSAGAVGMIHAIDRFDPSLGAPFEGFAKRRVIGAMTDSLRSADWAPRLLRNRTRAHRQAVEYLSQKLKRAPLAEEVAAYLGITVAELAKRSSDTERAFMGQLDLAIENGLEPKTLSPGPEDSLSGVSDLEAMRGALSTLTDREKTIINLYYEKKWCMMDIGAALGVSEARISQIHTEIIGKMRELVA